MNSNKLTETKLRNLVREVIEEKFLYSSSDIEQIVHTVFPNARVETDTQDRIPTGTGEVVTLANGRTYLVSSDLGVFDENGRKTEATELLEIVLENAAGIA